MSAVTPRHVIGQASMARNQMSRDAIADETLDALHAAGFAVVPVEPTEKMLDKGMLSLWNTEADEVAKAYRAMIAAAKETGDEA
jgi:hypothetical protein